MWDAGDANWGIYMGQSGGSKSFSGGTACSGAGFSAHAIRIRTGNNPTQGFIYENSSETCLFSLRSSDGLGYFAGSVGIGKTPSYKLDVNGDINITNGTLRLNGVDLLVPTGLTNQHYLYQTEFYLNGNWLYDMAINLSALLSFGDNTNRIYELHISGKSGDYGDVNVPMGSFLIYHSNYAGGKYMYNTLITPRGIQGAPNYLDFVGGNIVRFTTKNYNISSVYTKVILKSS